MARLFNGDCLDVMKDLSANSIDCFICDLPYGCLTGGAGKEKKKRRKLVRYVDGKATENTAVYSGGVIAGCAWDIPIDLAAFWEQVKRLAKDEHTPVLMFCTTKFGYELIKSNERWFRYDLVWDKGRGVSFLSANKMPLRSHEMIYVFAKAGARYERVDISGNFPAGGGGRSSATFIPGINALEKSKPTEAGRRCVKSVLSLGAKVLTKGQHPTEKPIALYEWLIRRYCPAGGTLLDPTAGSFNSVQAALNLGRKAIGIEKDEAFFKKAKERFAPIE